MRIIYIIIKFLTLPGAMLHAFFEHMSCRVCKVLVDDARVVRADEMLSHIDHELVKRRGASFNVCFMPFLFNLIIALWFLTSGAVAVLYLGEYTRWILWVLLYLGFAFLNNLFPQMEDVLMFKENLYSEKSSAFVKVIGSPIYGILYLGAQLERTGLSLLTSIGFTFAYPYILGLFIPKLYDVFTTM